MHAIILLISWIALGLYWLMASRAVKETAVEQPATERSKYWFLTGVSFALLAVPDILPFPFGLASLIGGTVTVVIGLILCVGGLITAIWARSELGRNWSATVAIKKDHELVQSGPYRYVRHPIYTGLLAMYLGTAFFSASLFAFGGFFLFFAIHLDKLRKEEALMLRQFPQTYPEYIKRTKAIIPFVL